MLDYGEPKKMSKLFYGDINNSITLTNVNNNYITYTTPIQQKFNQIEKKKKIYLAGSANLPHEKYRGYIKEKYSHIGDFKDPLYEEKKLNYFEIVELDKELIRYCNIVIAYIENASFGTPMELMYAYEQSKLIFIIAKNEEVKCDPWLNHHCDEIFDKIDACMCFIEICEETY